MTAMLCMHNEVMHNNISFIRFSMGVDGGKSLQKVMLDSICANTYLYVSVDILAQAIFLTCDFPTHPHQGGQRQPHMRCIPDKHFRRVPRVSAFPTPVAHMGVGAAAVPHGTAVRVRSHATWHASGNLHP